VQVVDSNIPEVRQEIMPRHCDAGDVAEAGATPASLGGRGTPLAGMLDGVPTDTAVTSTQPSGDEPGDRTSYPLSAYGVGDGVADGTPVAPGWTPWRGRPGRPGGDLRRAHPQPRRAGPPRQSAGQAAGPARRAARLAGHHRAANSTEFYLAVVAVWKLGAIPQPVSARLPAAELTALLEVANRRW